MVPKTLCNIFRSNNKLSPWRNWGWRWTNSFTNGRSDWGWNFSLLSKPLEAKGAWQHIKVGLSGCWYLHIYTVWKRLPFQWHTQNDSSPMAFMLTPQLSQAQPGSMVPLMAWPGLLPGISYYLIWKFPSHISIPKYSWKPHPSASLLSSTWKDKTGQKNFQIKKHYVLSISLNVKFLWKERALS